MTIYDINQIADYIVNFAQEAGSPITPLKLQKLVYYAQAWHLALHDEPLVDADFEAWVHGPVNRDLFTRFRHLKYRAIEQEVNAPILDERTEDFMQELLDEYLPLDAYELEMLTHREEPWMAARGTLAAEEPSQEIISRRTMQRYYKTQING